ncbi:orexin [Xenopus laevis]|uniref:Hypocretin neuropeptide precursor n=2 Tax=Xenopus laevis TaxID=8355 RepID=A0A974BW14_XENLA|nr:orexin [Xenopus laevis]OCT61994.1 hypothetical protein XELAEV_18043078mg [Xenopus laevis]
MESRNEKTHKSLLFLVLLCSLISTSHSAPDCCRQKTCSCRIYDILRGNGNHAAGILTLGKRRSDFQTMQSRLQRLLQGSGNHAAGILTMGRRSQDEEETNCINGPMGSSSTSNSLSLLTLLCPTESEPGNGSKGFGCKQNPTM